MVAMEVAAENATELPRLGRPRMKLNEHASQTSTKANEKSFSASESGEEKVTMEGRTGSDRGMPSMVDSVQELGAWDRTVTTKSVHHPRIRRYGKGTVHRAMKRRKCEHKSIGR